MSVNEDWAREAYALRRMCEHMPPDVAAAVLDQLHKLESMYRLLASQHSMMYSIMRLVKDQVDDLRLDVVGMQFDLEATRRERDELRND